MKKGSWRWILVVLALAFTARPAAAGFAADISLASPYYSLREIGTTEDDLVYQAYGAALYAEYTGKKKPWQIGMDYTYAAEDLGGRDIAITAAQLVLKCPRDQGEGTAVQYWTLSCRAEEIAGAGSIQVAATTVLLGYEVQSIAQDSGAFMAGAGLGWREQTMRDEYTASGLAVSVWVDLAVQLGGHSELRFSTTTTWTQPENAGYKIMEKDTITKIGWGIRF